MSIRLLEPAQAELGEAATWPMALSGCAILGGIGLVIWKKA